MAAAQVDYAQLVTLAWRGQLGAADMQRAADALAAQGQLPLAALLIRAWLQRGEGPARALALFQLGLLLTDDGDHAGARDAYLQAIELAPTLAAARYNLGLCHQRLGDVDAAVAQWSWIGAHAQPADPGQRALLVMALGNLALVHESAGRLGEALALQTRSLRLDPQQPELARAWLLLRARQCLWPVYDPLPGLDAATMRRGTSGADAMITPVGRPGRAAGGGAGVREEQGAHPTCRGWPPTSPTATTGCASPTARATSACTRWPC
jgi:predicted O-linked N-acetylglucosamine transferase (SPINDLY family)